MRFVLPAVLALLLAGCTTLAGPAPSGPSAIIDYTTADLAHATLILDLPDSIEPVDGRTSLVVGGLSAPIAFTLTHGDADTVSGGLPVPGGGRTYYLFALSEGDQAKVTAVQTQARGAAGPVMVTLAPALCRNSSLDPGALRYSVMLALPGSGPTSMAAGQPVGTTLPACAGHSG